MMNLQLHFSATILEDDVVMNFYFASKQHIDNWFQFVICTLFFNRIHKIKQHFAFINFKSVPCVKLPSSKQSFYYNKPYFLRWMKVICDAARKGLLTTFVIFMKNEFDGRIENFNITFSYSAASPKKPDTQAAIFSKLADMSSIKRFDINNLRIFIKIRYTCETKEETLINLTNSFHYLSSNLKYKYAANAGEFGKFLFKPIEDKSGEFGKILFKPKEDKSGEIGKLLFKPKEDKYGEFDKFLFKPKKDKSGEFGKLLFKPKKDKSGEFDEFLFKPKEDQSGEIVVDEVKDEMLDGSFDGEEVCPQYSTDVNCRCRMKVKYGLEVMISCVICKQLAHIFCYGYLRPDELNGTAFICWTCKTNAVRNSCESSDRVEYCRLRFYIGLMWINKSLTTLLKFENHRSRIGQMLTLTYKVISSLKRGEMHIDHENLRTAVEELFPNSIVN